MMLLIILNSEIHKDIYEAVTQATLTAMLLKTKVS